MTMEKREGNVSDCLRNINVSLNYTIFSLSWLNSIPWTKPYHVQHLHMLLPMIGQKNCVEKAENNYNLTSDRKHGRERRREREREKSIVQNS